MSQLLNNTDIMNILMVCVNFPPEPVVSAILTRDVVKELTSEGHNITVLRPKPTRPGGYMFKTEKSSISEIKEVVLDSFLCPSYSLIGRLKESRSFGKCCAEYIAKNHSNFGCVYVDAWPMFGQYEIIKATKKFGLNSVVHVQDVYPESYCNKLPKIFRSIALKLLLPMDTFILKNATKVIAISDDMKCYLVKSRNLQTGKVIVARNWHDESEFVKYKKKINMKKHDKFTFMYLGNIGPVAGVDLLIESFNKAKLSDARLVIAGSGSMKEKLQERAAAYKDIEFWNVPDGKVPYTQDKADVMILPVKQGAAKSSIPSKLPAYMFSAKPIIGSLDNNCDTAASIKNAKCGWIIEPENEEALAKKMIEVSKMDSACLQEIGEHGFNYAIENFSKKNIIGKIINLITSICNNV